MDLSIIILSYNTRDITDQCLERLQVSVDRCQKKNKNNIEVIVLDNASTDGSAEMIKSKHQWVNLIESKENTGYSRGNNIAFKKSIYPVVLFMNSDIFVEEDTICAALEYFKNPQCDVLGIGLKFANGSFQPSGGNLPDPPNTIFWITGISRIPIIREFTNPIHPTFKSFFESPTDVRVGWISGAFFMIKREVFASVGGFDENIFMYLEEIEFCKRANMAGFTVWYLPSVVVTHLHGASSQFDPSPALVRELKGLKYYFEKHYQNIYPLVKLFLILGLILRIIAFSLLGQTKRARTYVEGLGVV